MSGRSNPEGHQPFSVARLRSGMALFVAGKLASGLIGLAWLLVLVRALDLPAYAAYIVLIAMLEITLLVSNAGVYAFAQRYITEARLPHNLHLLPRLIWRSLAYRMLTLAAAALVLAASAAPLADWLGQPPLRAVLPLYAGVMVAEGAARYLELVFESLLEQGRAQACAIFRNGLRLLIVALLWRGAHPLSLVDVVSIELLCSGLGLGLACLLAWRGRPAVAAAVLTPVAPAADFSIARLAQFALPLYVAQCLTQLYSPDTIKLIVSRLLGAVEAATFGFAHAISFVLQRYLPATLLLGLVRPMLVARQQKGGQEAQLNEVGNLVLKINLLLLLPLAAVFAVAGSEFAGWVSGGRYRDAGLVLFLLTLLLILNGTHLVLSMLATTLENSRAVLWGTVVSVPGVLVGVALAPRLGSAAMVMGLWASELLWCSFTLILLRRSGFGFRIDAGAWLKLIAAAALAAAAAWLLLLLLTPMAGLARLMVSAAVVLPVYLLAGLVLRPFSASERGQVLRLLPARFRGGRA